MATAISTKQLSKQFGKFRGINDVTLDVEEGEIFGFIGPNGSGKSTTIRAMLGLLKPTAGSIELFGKDITTNGPELRENIGYLPSEVSYYDNMKVIDLLRYSASFYAKSRKATEDNMYRLAKLLDLDLQKKIDDLSYGNKKKVGIIQCLQHKPKLIILDEPTGGLDPLMQKVFFDLLQEAHKNGATIFLSSHVLSEVRKLCDRVAIIKEGKIIDVQSMELLRKSSYVKVQFEPSGPIAKSQLSLPGINNITSDGGQISFLYSGDINPLTALIAKLSLKNLCVEEPDLEEIFMHYYQKD